jgi:hypothetical protein
MRLAEHRLEAATSKFRNPCSGYHMGLAPLVEQLHYTLETADSTNKRNRRVIVLGG